MQLLLTYEDNTQELLPIASAKTQLSGVATFNLPQWYERYTQDDQVKMLDYIGNIDGDEVNVIVVPLENSKYKFCKLFYKDAYTCKEEFYSMINKDFINSECAIMWFLIDALGIESKFHFNTSNL